VNWWNVVHKGNRAALRTADGHYSRQKPGTSQFTRPGDNLVLLGADEASVWVSWRPAVGERMDCLKVYECVMFNRKGGPKASEQIEEAIALTEEMWGPPPADGWLTFIKPDAVRSEVKGYCFRRAGFKSFGTNANGKLLRLRRTGGAG
jgi:hypothetical protein